MQTLAIQQVRQGWRAVLEAARFHGTATVITYHDQPVAIVIAPEDVGRDQHPGAPGESDDADSDAGAEVGVGEARARLRELVDAARDGRATAIVRHGVPVAQLVPYSEAALRPGS